jgi:hypothetical protein
MFSECFCLRIMDGNYQYCKCANKICTVYNTPHQNSVLNLDYDRVHVILSLLHEHDNLSKFMIDHYMPKNKLLPDPVTT